MLGVGVESAGWNGWRKDKEEGKEKVGKMMARPAMLIG